MDIVYVTYNSQKWIDMCISSLLNSQTDLKRIHLWVVDNHSTDETVVLLKKNQEQFGGKFGSFEIICSSENLGFGKANNKGALLGKDDIICFFNIDTEVFPDTLRVLTEAINQSITQVAIWELRQLPYEHPKLYNPVTQETSWSSGAAFAIKRDIFESLNGFDPNIFMYAEDVDLSWRVRKAGYKIQYISKAAIMHYSYQAPGEIKPTQRVYSIVNNLWLRHKFGTFSEIIWGYILFIGYICLKNDFTDCRRQLWHAYVEMHKKLKYITRENQLTSDFHPTFLRFDYEITRDGAYYTCVRNLAEQPLVSILVRTCGRPAVLRETLRSLENQTYQNFEIVIVEDGENVSERMILQEFKHLNIRYFSTGKKVGRSKVGNIAMEKATGAFLNFLDDDDLFFADHIETLVNAIQKSDKKVAYATAYETPIEIISKEPYQYNVFGYKKQYRQAYDPIQLCHHNYIPIQCVMFAKELFERYGGLDENLDALEDWDLWVRYSLHTDFEFVEKTTSIYRVPHNAKVNAKRQKVLDEALQQVREKHKTYMQKVSVYDIAMFYERSR